MQWGRTYSSLTLTKDLVASLVVTVMLIPQSLAYAMLAGLPPEFGLYASTLPLLIYALLGTSTTLAVGPVAVVSLMTAGAVSQVAVPGSEAYIGAAIILALLSGFFLLLLGVFRLGFVANFLSHPIITGFVSGSGILIAASQLKHILGVPASGRTLVEITLSLAQNSGVANIPTLITGVSVIGFLFFMRNVLEPLLKNIDAHKKVVVIITKLGPVAAILATSLFVVMFGLDAKGVDVVGDIPSGMPQVGLPSLDVDLWRALAPAAILISLVGFVESVSIGQMLAAKRRQRINPDQELIGLGAANIAAAMSSGFPVAGGFARSVVNFDAGARTPAAGAFAAFGIAITTTFFTPLFKALPVATLAAIIIVAVLGLVDLKAIGKVWVYSKADFCAMLSTMLLTLSVGVEAGVVTGILLSVLFHLYRTSKPHIAIVGLVPGTEHFRNVNRHSVVCSPKILSMRIDESLYFANTRVLENYIYNLISRNSEIEELILMCSAVNEIDISALESLQAVNDQLRESGVRLHLSEIKGPVMDRLMRTQFIGKLTGEVFLSHYTAWITLNSDLQMEETLPAPST